MTTALKTNTDTETAAKTKDLTKLDDIAEHETAHVNFFQYFGGDYCDGDLHLYKFVDTGKLGLNADLADHLSVVKYEHDGRKLKLLSVVATAGTCDLFSDNDGPALTAAGIEKIMAAVDGWLVTTLIGGADPRLCLSVVRKTKWIEAGRPMVLDVSFIPKPKDDCQNDAD